MIFTKARMESNTWSPSNGNRSDGRNFEVESDGAFSGKYYLTEEEADALVLYMTEQDKVEELGACGCGDPDCGFTIITVGDYLADEFIDNLRS